MSFLKWPLLLVVGPVAVVMLLTAVLPPVLRGWVQDQATAQLGREVRIESLGFNPLSLKASVTGFSAAGRETQSPALLAFKTLELDLSLSSLWHVAPVVDAVLLDGLRLSLARTGDGHYDVDDLIARFAKPKPAEPEKAPGAMPRFALNQIALRDGELTFDDQPVGRVHRLQNLLVELPFLSNLDAVALATPAKPHIAFELDGTTFDTAARATALAPLPAGQLQLRMGDLDLGALAPYVPQALPVRLPQGRFSAELAADFATQADAPPRLSLSGTLTLKGVQVTDRDAKPLLQWGLFEVKMADVQPLRQQVALDSIVLDDLLLEARRDAQGRLEVQRLLLPEAAASSAPSSATSAPAEPSLATRPSATPAQPWTISSRKLALHGVAVHWQDQAVQPAADVTLTLAQLDARNLRWPLAAGQPATEWDAECRVRSGQGESSGPLLLSGRLDTQGGQARLKLRQWGLDLARPYLAAFLVPRVDGQLALEAGARWAGLPGAELPTLELASLAVTQLKLVDPARPDAGVQAGWQNLELRDGQVDLAAHQVRVGQVQLQQARLKALRAADGSLNLAQWVKPMGAKSSAATTAPPASPQPAPDAGPAWTVQLGQFRLVDAAVAWRDAATGDRPVALDLDQLNLNLGPLAWPAVKGQGVPLEGGARLAQAGDAGSNAVAGPNGTNLSNAPNGRIGWKGEASLAPLGWRGSLTAEQLALGPLDPYLAGLKLPVRLLQAEVGLRTQIQLVLAEAGLSLDLQGEAALARLRLQTRGTQPAQADDPEEDVLRWQTLAAQGLHLVLEPGKKPRVVLGEGRLDDLFARVFIDEKGGINLSKLVPPAAAASAPVAGAVAASAPSAPVSAPAEFPIDLQVGGLALRNAKVDFIDHFIQPHFSADLSQLSGRLGAFRSGDPALSPLELTGKIAGTGLLDIRGAVQPLAQPLALDLQVQASDIELEPASPYMVRYAGYGITRGQLSARLNYLVEPDGRLKAGNRLILNQLTLGSRAESSPAPRLPVPLALALLRNRQGVIDLNLPISGSLNDPQFGIGQVIAKVLGNLVTKALSAPFALLSGSDDDEQLHQIAFQPGTARPVDSAAAALDKVASALREKDDLRLDISGSVDGPAERAALANALLEAQLQAERLREKTGSAVTPAQAAAAGAVSLSPEERLRLLRRLQSAKGLPQPAGLAPQATPVQQIQALSAQLQAADPVNDDDVRELALQRSLVVRDQLVARQLARERLFLIPPRLRQREDEPALSSVGVELALGSDG